MFSVSGLYYFCDYGFFIQDLKCGDVVIIFDVFKDSRIFVLVDCLFLIGIFVLLNVLIMVYGIFVGVMFVYYDKLYIFIFEEKDFVCIVVDCMWEVVLCVCVEQE